MKPRPGLISTTLLMTVGILRDYRQRRWAMFYILLASLLLTFVGSIFLMDWLKARLLLFCVYWLVVGWLTLTALLLAIFDLLLVRKSGIEAQRELRKSILRQEEETSDAKNP